MPPCRPPAPAAPAREKQGTVIVGSLVVVAGLVVIFWLWSVLEARRRAGVVRWANETVREHTQAAEQHLAKREWDQALDCLEQALAVPQATERARVQELMTQVRKGQTEMLLESAFAAVRNQDLERARNHLDELDKATSDEMAQALLQRLSEADLARFAEEGLAAEVDRLRQEPLRAVYKETLQRNLMRERQRRETEELERLARREAERRTQDEEAQRQLFKKLLEEQQAKKASERKLTRIRATPVYHELTEYLDLVRQQDRKFRGPVEDDRRLLAALLTGPRKLKKEERDRLVEELRNRLDVPRSRDDFVPWQEEVKAAVSAKRAQFKERFRQYPEFTRADWDLFDPLVDQELDQLLKEVRRPLEDDFALGLRALVGK